MEKKRRIVYRDKCYQVLKPKENRNGWHEHGRRKRLKGIYHLIESGKYELEIPEYIQRDLLEYAEKREMGSRNYKKGLVSKVI